MSVRVLIVDDEALARDRLRQLLASHPEVEIVGEAGDGKEALTVIRDCTPDLVFLDIQMPELDGFEMLEALRGRPLPVIVFVTAHNEFALRAFEVHAVDYLLKPFDRERFDAACRHAILQVRNRESDHASEGQAAMLAELRPPARPLERLAVKSGGEIVWVGLNDIDWIASADNYVELHLDAKSYLLRETLNALEERLPPDRFVRISRSTIVNRERVRSLRRMLHGGYEVTLHNGTRLTLSRRFRGRLPQLGLS